MSGVVVRFRQFEVVYFPAGEPVRAGDPIMNFDELEDRLLAEHPRMRRILFPISTTGRRLGLYYLHWSDGSDLRVLDEMVVGGIADESDFAGAVVGEARGIWHLACGADGTWHPVCGAQLRVVCLEPVLFTLLRGNDRSELSKHRYHSRCVACGGPISARPLEYIDEARYRSEAAGIDRPPAA
ncbi:hypothetical protein MXD63_09985 [Frankia sp. Cpl3]|nr:hypothetical protein [Frankia sp. Cpl3]